MSSTIRKVQKPLIMINRTDRTFFSVIHSAANIQGDQLKKAAFFWYLVRSDFSRVRSFVQVTFYRVPETHNNV